MVMGADYVRVFILMRFSGFAPVVLQMLLYIKIETLTR